MINWGLAGVGDISRKRVAAAIQEQPDSKLYAAHSPFIDELDKFTNDFNVEKGFLELDDMLTDRNIDAIYIATPVFLHSEIALRSLAAGKHVLVEKPMAMTEADCLAILAAATENNVKLGVSYYRRFYPKIYEVRRLLAEGAIGDVVSARVTFHSWSTFAKDDPKYWRLIKAKAGGGPLWDMGCHKLDLIMAVLGQVKSVYAVMDTLTHECEVEDSCTALLELKNGAHCQLSFNWNSKVWADEFVILGTGGKISMIPADGDTITVELPPRVMRGMGKEITEISLPAASNVHFPLIDDFARAIIEDKAPAVSGETGYETNRLLAAFELSNELGKKIDI